MQAKRIRPSLTVTREVMHEAGYKCANPACRMILSLDRHHIESVSERGSNSAANLVVLCGNCHDLHHKGIIPLESIRAWKMLLVSLNNGFPRASVDLLLALDCLGRNPMLVSTDSVLMMGSLIASGLVTVSHPYPPGADIQKRDLTQSRFIGLSDKGLAFVAAWKEGNQEKALGLATPAGPDKLDG